jgi:hypothetical protein
LGAFFAPQKTGLSAPIFWLTPKGFPLQSLARKKQEKPLTTRTGRTKADKKQGKPLGFARQTAARGQRVIV